MKKKSTLYIIILSLWVVCLGILAYSLTNLILKLDVDSLVRKIFIIIFLTINALVLGALWLGSLKDLVFSLAYAFNKKKINKEYEKINAFEPSEEKEPRFLLVYCTCNDFNHKALSKSKAQDYKNFTTVILDDSSDPKYRKQIDKYVIRHDNVSVVRRSDHTGYKAGNMNNYLKGRTDYDYFVVLDSDEIIPSNYIKKVLKYFNYNKHCGAVQAKHTATKGHNAFQRLMGLSVDSNGSTVQIIKNFYGANALIGHGMTISRECYEKTGGFPLVVAEDISMAVKIKDNGFEIIYAPDILCYEEFPIDYVSLKKRQCKWTQGNLEYMRKFDKEINNSSMTWFEKLDIKLSHYSLPIVPILSFLLTLCTITLGFLGYPVIKYSLFIYTAMIVFLCSPLLPDLFVYKKTKNVFLLIPYYLTNICTYASLAPMMLKTIFLGILGKKAVFVVTPKNSNKYHFKDIIKYTYDSLIFATVISVLCYLACGSILPVIFITVGCLASPFIILLSNIPVKEEEVKFKDEIVEKKIMTRNEKLLTKDLKVNPFLSSTKVKKEENLEI